ncbi:hypothetical protein [Modicisalibacter xianhensis]|uniref:Uncharacterized protein n=1 Tax=Modicisalibacter xianhensis TaxID=442341 RepID=A0A1I2YTI3_9GAMM|nr:hypothetical protein [Halomonas xianhensis]TDX31569.1 hypothetical protein DFO67_103167 [Halomonas xianhensis]SFH28770.1 hypothetical protein SAMN04487959_102138 [Halomonas xianhensis]
MDFANERTLDVPQWWLKPRVGQLAEGVTCHVIDRNSPVAKQGNVTKLAYYQLRVDEIGHDTCRCTITKRMN